MMSAYFLKLPDSVSDHEIDVESSREFQWKGCRDQDPTRNRESGTQTDYPIDDRTPDDPAALRVELERARDTMQFLESHAAQLTQERDVALQQAGYFKEKLARAQQQKVQHMIDHELEMDKRTQAEKTAQDQRESYERLIEFEKEQTHQLSNQIEHETEAHRKIVTGFELERIRLLKQVDCEHTLKDLLGEELNQAQDRIIQLEMDVARDETRFHELRQNQDRMKRECDMQLQKAIQDLLLENKERENAENNATELTRKLEATRNPVLS